MARRLLTSAALRPYTWRLGRKLYREARQERDNNPQTNGEYWLIEQYIRRSAEQSPTFLDIGANVGNWSQSVSDLLDRYRSAGRIMAFEPSEATYEALKRRFTNASNISVSRQALGNKIGTREFWISSPLSGTNSLHRNADAIPESVSASTLDQVLFDTSNARADYVKSDTEGFDFEVLLGAENALRTARIDIWQFEYNHLWIYTRTYLKDVFDYIQEMPYLLGKLYGNGIEFYEEWHPELERFFETNYVLVKKTSKYAALGKTAAFNQSNVAITRELLTSKSDI